MNSNKLTANLGLAKNIDIDLKDNSDGKTTIFTLSDTISDSFCSFILPNIERNLGSYIIFDKNNELYNLYKNDISGYEIKHFALSDTFNIFDNITTENDIQNFVDVTLRNHTEIQRYLYEGHNEADLLYTYTDLILNLILIYLCEKTASKNKNFAYINKILKKLKQNDLAYFIKIFSEIDSTYKVSKSLFHLKYMNDKEYQHSLDIITSVLSMTIDTKCKKNTIIDDMVAMCKNPISNLLFIELTDNFVIDSYFCTYVEHNLNKENTQLPIFCVYNALENVFISHFDKLLELSNNQNIIHVLNFSNIATIIKLYGKEIRTIMNNISYGIIFQSNNSKNIKYIQKLLSSNYISDMTNQIRNDSSCCIVYKKPNTISIEKKITKSKKRP